MKDGEMPQRVKELPATADEFSLAGVKWILPAVF